MNTQRVSHFSIHGHLTLQVLDLDMKVVHQVSADNIWTLTGREFLVQLMALRSRSPRGGFRDDRVGFIGLGAGVQPKVANITSLVDPVPYRTDEFLAHLAVPAQFPASGTTEGITAVRFIRTFARDEVSLSGSVVVTEAGLFTDGDPDNEWGTLSTPTDFATTAGRAPVAYNTFEPITKTPDNSLRVIWDVRII